MHRIEYLEFLCVRGGFFMDKAIIIGVYEYLGFHLCLKFLEEG